MELLPTIGRAERAHLRGQSTRENLRKLLSRQTNIYEYYKSGSHEYGVTRKIIGMFIQIFQFIMRRFNSGVGFFHTRKKNFGRGTLKIETAKANDVGNGILVYRCPATAI